MAAEAIPFDPHHEDVQGSLSFTETESQKLLLVGHGEIQDGTPRIIYATLNTDPAAQTRCKFYFGPTGQETLATYTDVKRWRKGFWTAQFPHLVGSNLVRARCQRIEGLFTGVDTIDEAINTVFGEEEEPSASSEDISQKIYFAKCLFNDGKVIEMLRVGTGTKKHEDGPGEALDIFASCDEKGHVRFWWGPTFKVTPATYYKLENWLPGLRVEDVLPRNAKSIAGIKNIRQARIKEFFKAKDNFVAENPTATTQGSLQSSELGPEEVDPTEEETSDGRPAKRRKVAGGLTAGSPPGAATTSSEVGPMSLIVRLKLKRSPDADQQESKREDGDLQDPSKSTMTPAAIGRSDAAASVNKPVRTTPTTPSFPSGALPAHPESTATPSPSDLLNAAAGANTPIRTTTSPPSSSSGALPAPTMSSVTAFLIGRAGDDGSIEPEELQRALSVIMTITPPLKVLRRAVRARLRGQIERVYDHDGFVKWMLESGAEMREGDQSGSTDADA